ncbi:WbqC family protein [Vibrio paucivorans]|uniref:WbqC family protein n=1 Tax=Vibrio paucivorans TaxID=2829489 RepID=A0A9X3CBR0_9VIBR|nr:WbqC family protein [Vibrio paucivorans]MCW8332813.1 WbqC family protein [Vibrio paucivorans]
MKLALMQPYIFPYLGYYQLAYESDVFVFYDDVTYIKGGYINRNNILVGNNPQRFTIPLVGASSNKKINEIYCSDNMKKIVKTVSQAYIKSPNYKKVMPLIESVLYQDNRNLSCVATSSILSVFDYLGIEINYNHSSKLNYMREGRAEEKIYSICGLYEANKYINTIGGMSLYNKKDFSENGVELSFIEKQPVKYSQGLKGENFVDNLSIIDALMWCSKTEVKELLNQSTRS